MKQQLISVAEKLGYQQKGYGYCKIVGEVTHWIILFEGSKLQLYGYYTQYESDAYNTQIIYTNPVQLQTLIEVFNESHK